jgi:hypothetical protein
MAPAGVLGTNASITRDGRSLIVQTSQNGVVAGFDPGTGQQLKSNSSGIWDTRTGRVTDMGSLNRNTCFGGSQIAPQQIYIAQRHARIGKRSVYGERLFQMPFGVVETFMFAEQ